MWNLLLNLPCMNDTKWNFSLVSLFVSFFLFPFWMEINPGCCPKWCNRVSLVFFSLLIAAQRIRMWNYFELVIFYGLWMQLPPLPCPLFHRLFTCPRPLCTLCIGLLMCLTGVNWAAYCDSYCYCCCRSCCCCRCCCWYLKYAIAVGAVTVAVSLQVLIY